MWRLQTIAALVVCIVNTSAMANEYKVGSIEIINPWSRASPKGAATAIGYMTIKNNGTAPERLIGGSIEVAAGLEMHSMAMDNGISRMRELKDVDIQPGQAIEFKPGGSHVMFVRLKHQLLKGEHINGTLVFQRAGEVKIEYDVLGIGEQRGPQSADHL
jgi:hypothetical protein